MNKREELRKHLENSKNTLPKKEKFQADMKRLIDLARNSIHGSVNVDFIDRMEGEWKSRESELKFEKQLVEISEMALGDKDE